MAGAAGGVDTTCAYCGVGCGMRVTPRAQGGFSIAGDPTHPANYGRLCAKGAALGDTLGHDDRLLHPEVGGQRVAWDAALAAVAARFQAVIDSDGPDAVAFYVSGQLLTEDYYVANKLMKGFIGSANIDTNSRLCMASSVAGHNRAFGEDVVPGVYADFELADLVVLVGSNLAWCHPVLHQRLMAARELRGTRIVVIDPRATATTADADLHLALNAGSDVALFNGLLRHLSTSGALDEDYIAAHTSGFAATLAAAMPFDVDHVAAITGLAPNDLGAFYQLFATHGAAMTVYSQGVNQSRTGTDKVNAIINCHLATGRVGKPGSGPFSVTGQPNAMGGRETGGLANMLAAHLDLDDAEHRRLVQDYWRSPRMPTQAGLKAVDLFEAVAAGRIKALWIMATNPVVSMPAADRVAAAIAACPFVVVSDITRRADTAALADVLLPAAGWGEKDGTVTNSERRVSRQRAFVTPPGEARPDWWALAGVARHMGHGDAFAYTHPAEIYREFAALTALARAAGRVLDFAHDSSIDQAAYDAMAPRTWPLAPRGVREQRLFADGIFATADGRAHFVPLTCAARSADAAPAATLVLNTGRLRDQWHTMTRSGRAALLCSHTAEPQVDMHPQTAREHGLEAAGLAVLESASARVIARVAISARQPPGTVFVPMHWSAQTAALARVNTLVEARTDPISGQPDLKSQRVAVQRFAACWYGFGIFTHRPERPRSAYWAQMRSPRGWRLELADDAPLKNFAALFTSLAGDTLANTDQIEYQDLERDAHRVVATRDGCLIAALYVARAPVAVLRNWAADRLGAKLAGDEAHALLAGFPLAGGVQGASDVVCACHQVGSGAIAASIQAGSVTLADIGKVTAAGTNCGSCRIEIQKMIGHFAGADTARSGARASQRADDAVSA